MPDVSIFQSLLGLAAVTGLVFALIYAAVLDATVFKITNKVNLLILVTFVLVLPSAWTGWEGLGLHLLSGLAFLVVGFGLFAIGSFGAGDAKMMAAVALFFTPMEAFAFFLYTTLLGGGIALLIMLIRTYLPIAASPNGLGYGLFSDAKRMPYGIAISLAALIMLPTCELVLRALGG